MLILKASALQMRMDREGIPEPASKKFRTPPSSTAAQVIIIGIIFVLLPNIGNFVEILISMKTTSVALGPYFEDFIKAQISKGRYNNASEVIRAALRLLEDNESRVMALKAAIQDGLDSGEAEGFDPQAHLTTLKNV